MSQEITDAMLDEQTEHLTSLFAMAGYGTFTQDPERIYRNVTRAALEVERESLRLLTIMQQWADLEEDAAEVHQIAAHIQVLRTRLGITSE